MLGPLRTWFRRLAGQRSVGARGEQMAARYLQKHGYRILASNLHNRFGEIDILAEAPDKRTIVVVEVKTAAYASDAYPPEQHVTPAKQRKLVALAAQLARQYDLTDRPLRFDIVAVDGVEDSKTELRHHIGAFESQV